MNQPASTAARNGNSFKITDKEFDGIIAKAVRTYGADSQIKMLFEEMSELQNAICKLARGRDTNEHVCEEIADVMIMCFQMARIFGSRSVARWGNIKLERLKKRLENTKNSTK